MSECIYCCEETNGTCGCEEAMDAYGQVQCVFCDRYYSLRFSAEEKWVVPCGECVEAYVKDYKEHVAKAKAPEEAKAPEAKAKAVEAKAKAPEAKEALHVPGFTVHAAIDLRNRPALSYEAACAEADDVLAALARM